MYPPIRIKLLSVCLLLACETSGTHSVAPMNVDDESIGMASSPTLLDEERSAASMVGVGGQHAGRAGGIDADETMGDDTGGRTPAGSESGPAPLPMNRPAYACRETGSTQGLIHRPRGPEFDDELAGKARTFERVYRAISTHIQNMNADIGVTDDDAKAAIIEFADSADWDFEAITGRTAESVIARSGKGAGLYAGMGIAADAYRYAQLREGHGRCEDLAMARQAVEDGLGVLHMATAITGEKGVMVRALARANTQGDGMNALTPLFDEAGQPLPKEKNNGTWRADNSGQYPDYIWEDSCSRDMLIGWVVAYAAVWEVIATDPAFEPALKTRLRQDAWFILESLMIERDDGYDLEIRDADGRRTYHGILNENSIDRVYFDGAPNGFNAVMAVGIVAALSYVSGDPTHGRYLQQTLVGDRDLIGLASMWLGLLHAGTATNFSGYNMIFTAAWLALRYVTDETTHGRLRDLVIDILYPADGASHAPNEQGQALYDLVAAVAFSGARVGLPGLLNTQVTETMDKVVTVLRSFPRPPFFGESIENCDAQEIETNTCIGQDGTALPLSAKLGWNDTLSADVPVPMAIRPRSNYYWRSNPYQVNGTANPLDLMPASDFRFVYWAGRHVHIDVERP
ncbi:MAG: hypothetical protein VX589_14575 [Myxococcota bacterium]|nr:hypothetical protein [Myxococcota bacterium]